MSRLLDIVPSEIWRICWEHSDQASLARLCRTCSIFLDICQPLLFQTRVVIIPHQSRSPDTTAEALDYALAQCKQRFLDVASHPRIAHYVRSLELRDELAPDPTGHPDLNAVVAQFKTLVPKVFLDGLSAFSNLRSLQLHRISLSGDGRRALDALSSSLVDLHLYNCTLVSGRALPLKRLTIGHCEAPDTGEPLFIVDPRTVEDLSLRAGVTTSERAHFSVLRALAEETEPFSRLRNLSLEVPGLSATLLLAFLEKCTGVTTLFLVYPTTFLLDGTAKPTFVLPSTYLPNVHEIFCTYNLVGYLLPGRAVRTLKIFGYVMDKDSDLLATLSGAGKLSAPQQQTLQNLFLLSPLSSAELGSVIELVQSTPLPLRELSITLECQSNDLGLPLSGFMAFIHLLSTQDVVLPPLLEALTVVVMIPRNTLEFSQIYGMVDLRELAARLAGPALQRFLLHYDGKNDLCIRLGPEGEWMFERREILVF
uniref:F-box domain-containing protein n=1 Tax=Mycena chlorophos TaxID=658473 RepID=A0ABQ0LCT5_MYCCL|nr:predicted protein [Mycena chlorophos]